MPSTTGSTTVVQVDADGQHVADHIRHLLAALDASTVDGHPLDMVVGSRFAGDADYPMTVRPQTLRAPPRRS